MPRKPVAGNKRPYRWVREIGQIDRDDVRFFGLIYSKEQGRYPFSSVQRMPDIVLGDSRSTKFKNEIAWNAEHCSIPSTCPTQTTIHGQDRL
eukprot:2174228-Amphidinium_carterae.1